ncbi:endonuclease MutS2 [Thermostichus vulcanus]|uniref:Endonuclease MutS2 n=1 Tax=Thermostichus vulcanus str. 'Rupite' TaxID=2813851 RepID=A0ABT0C9R6_THEVL|nr:endonuclease MutS2 [Thermostichus vulcanus]MCJ2542521.1 endonuclease MutS2 [Thermostichus vulcanus str. 'Rupite']
MPTAPTLHPPLVGPDPSLRQETLELLEWPRLCQHLATFAATSLGRRACLELDPWLSQDRSREHLDQTEEAIRLEQSQPGGLSLEGIHDLLAALERAERGGILSGEELIQIATTLGTARRIRRLIDADTRLPRLQEWISPLRTYPELEQEIFRCLEDHGEVRDSASPTLADLRRQQRQQRSHIQERLHQLMNQYPQALQDTLISQRQGRFVLMVKASHRDVIQGIVHDSSASGATLYVEPYAVVELGNRLRQTQAQTQAEEERILAALSAQVGSVAPDLEQLQALMVGLDVALARGRYSLWLEGNRPQFVSAGLRLRQVRHPLLLWQSRLEGNESGVIPIDFTLAENIRAVVITGPNTGGKTVALKTLGLLTLMAKAGIFLPAQDPPQLPWFDEVYADIGDEQSLQQSLSTFSGHIRRISRMVQALRSTSQSVLILLDEVGAGTDPTEGAALAAGLLEFLSEHAQLTLATTHYGELKALKYQHPGFENASVEFDEATLAPTYRLLWGIPGRSNALTIAQRLHLDAEILERAKQRLQGESQVDVVIAGLEEQRADLEARAAAVGSLHRELEALQRQMQQRSRQMAEREAQLEQKQTQGIQALLAAAREEVAAAIRKLQQGDAPQQITAKLDEIQERYSPPPAPVETEFVPEIGDRVRLRGLGHTGEVIAVEEDVFVVRSGILKFTVPRGHLDPIDEHQAKQRQRPKAPPPAPSAPAPLNLRTRQNTLDLRGKTIADAEILLEQHFAQAPPGPVWIIHGHGTGRLRAGVQAYLREHPRVQSFEAAESQDGGTGVTVAQLR